MREWREFDVPVSVTRAVRNWCYNEGDNSTLERLKFMLTLRRQYTYAPGTPIHDFINDCHTADREKNISVWSAFFQEEFDSLFYHWSLVPKRIRSQRA